MSIAYYMYHPDTGKLLSDKRYCGMPFLFTENAKYGRPCAIEWDRDDYDIMEKIKTWSCEKDSELYKRVFDVSNSWLINENDIATYYTKDEILKMQKTMTRNKTLLEEFMNDNNADGLIVIIF